ncbi:hypothetical protein MMC09_000345 [Bachmanniomyces sp. S44760]|nr:hypothetical protein [Bachmanniomyces sp. S44760]
MPPLPSQDEDQIDQEGFLQLSNQDVLILHNIVLRAQDDQDIDTSPFRAIIAAYDHILARHGLNPNKDQIFLRFLFKLGNRKQAGASLYERFEVLLGELGIQLEFDGSEDGSGSSKSQAVFSTNDNTNSENPTIPSIRPRPASFSTFHDHEDYVTPRGQRRTASRASLSHIQYHSEGRPKRQDAVEEPFGGPRQARSLREDRNKLLRTDFHAQLPERFSLLSKKDPTGSLNHVTNQAESINAYVVSDTAERVSFQEAFQCRPSETQLYRDADLISSYRILSSSKDLLVLWHRRAIQARNDHITLSKQAIEYDLKALLRQAFEHWHVRAFHKRQASDIDRFFDGICRRASRARDLYLLTKAFTHWAHCAADEHQYNMFAQRHLLWTRYFGAWKKILTLNEAKIRHFRVQNIIFLWRRRMIAHSTSASISAASYRWQLAQHSYWRWFWSFCDKRAPEWRIFRTKKSCFVHWLSAYQLQLRKERNLRTMHIARKRNFHFFRWLERTTQVRTWNRQADIHDKNFMKAQCAKAWIFNLKAVPIARHISNLIEWRISRSAFAIMFLRAKTTYYAMTVSRLRILRNALTSWNDHLRWATLSRQIEDRLVMDALYKWVLLERHTIFARLLEQHCKQRALKNLIRSWKGLSILHNKLLERSIVQSDYLCRCSVLKMWSLRNEQRCQTQKLATLYQKSRLTLWNMRIWNTLFSNYQQHDMWANDAANYFRGTRSLRRWNHAIIQAQQEKRREAYVHVRRRLKMTLVRKSLHLWHRVFVGRLGEHQKAAEADYEHVCFFARSMFDSWRTRTQAISAHVVLASRRTYEINTHRQLQSWIACFGSFGTMQEQADLIVTGRTTYIAFTALRRMQIKRLELQSRGEITESLRRMNEKRHTRELIGSWRGKLSYKRICREEGVDSATVVFVASGFDKKPTVEQMHEKRQTETNQTYHHDWASKSVVQSQYSPSSARSIRTPSKRAARARDLAKGLRTPVVSTGRSHLLISTTAPLDHNQLMYKP